MKTMRINNLEQWIAQNDAFTLDCIEGCLLDNFFVACRRGIAFIFEEYQNANSSAYVCYFFRHNEVGSSEYKTAADRWEAIAREYDEMTA